MDDKWEVPMLGTHDFPLFLMAGITLNVLPGPDTLYIVGRSVAQGRRAGFLSVLGIGSGAFIHTTAAALGVSAILVTSAFAFSLVKWAGATYLVYLGIRMLTGKSDDGGGAADPAGMMQADGWSIYRQGLMTNLLNPKVAMFFLAFLPQFVDPDQSHGPLPFLFLGGVFIFTGSLWCFFLAAVADKVSGGIRSRSSTLQTARRVTGLLFAGLGLRLAFQPER